MTRTTLSDILLGVIYLCVGAALYILLGLFGVYGWLKHTFPTLDDIIRIDFLAAIGIAIAIAIVFSLQMKFPILRRAKAWVKNLRVFKREPRPDDRPTAAAPAKASPRVNLADRPRGATTSKLVWALLALSLLGNAAVGMIAWKTHRDQQTIGIELHRVAILATEANDRSVLARERASYNNDRLLGLEHRMSGLAFDWLEMNLDELNRLLLLGNRTDFDRDGVVDAKDECPTFVGNPSYDAHPGCPLDDRDGDYAADIEDVCPDEIDEDGLYYKNDGDWRIYQTYRESLLFSTRLPNRIEAAYYGCPDGDGDGIPDRVDLCPEAYADDDENIDGCPDEEQDFSQGGVVDHRYVTEKPAYGDSSGKLVGRFTAERTVGDVVVEFLIACEAMGADGAQLPGTTEDYSLVKKWGACRPAAH